MVKGNDCTRFNLWLVLNPVVSHNCMKRLCSAIWFVVLCNGYRQNYSFTFYTKSIKSNTSK